MPQTLHSTLPNNTATFLSDLRTFLTDEDAERFNEQFGAQGVVVSGGLHGTAAGLTGAPSPLTAYAGGYRIIETASITYDDAKTTWVIAHKDLSGLPASPGNFVRVVGTHYLVDDVTGATQPALPVDCTWLMKTTTAGGSITAVVDLRKTQIVSGEVITAEGDLLIGDSAGSPTALPIGATGGILLVTAGTLVYLAPGAAGDLLHIVSGTLAYGGGWTTKGDLVAHNGTTTVRIPVGTNGQLLVADSADAEGVAWKPGLTTRGDLLVRGLTDYARLALGASGLPLTSDGVDTVYAVLGLAGGGTGATAFTALRIVRANAAGTALEATSLTAPTSDLVGINDAQTLTNKTLTAPTIADHTNANHDHSNAANGGLTSGQPRSALKTTTASLSGTLTDFQSVDLTLNGYAFWPHLHATETVLKGAVVGKLLVSGHTTDAADADSARLSLLCWLPSGGGSVSEDYDLDYRYIQA